jgi:hypothetical protein
MRAFEMDVAKRERGRPRIRNIARGKDLDVEDAIQLPADVSGARDGIRDDGKAVHCQTDTEVPETWWIGKPCRHAPSATEFPGHKVRASHLAAKGLIFIRWRRGRGSKENTPAAQHPSTFAPPLRLRPSNQSWVEIGVTP